LRAAPAARPTPPPAIPVPVTKTVYPVAQIAPPAPEQTNPRLGTLGIVLVALLAAAASWAVSWLLASQGILPK
ncbi:MAG TPA: hypothetical protein DDY78_06835, partial [Planctomycetales bacterium]|nr:hypothetical protein [Planctomycetales bacterium]